MAFANLDELWRDSLHRGWALLGERREEEKMDENELREAPMLEARLGPCRRVWRG